MSVTVVDKGYKAIMAEVARLNSLAVNVGIQAGSGKGIAERAFFNEYGTKTIPERSFMRTAFDENLPDINSTVDRLVAGVLGAKITAQTAASVLGERHQGQIKSNVKSGTFTANSQITIDRKFSSKPLIDTGEMLNSIRYEVK